MSQHVSIWGVFPDQTAAGQALTKLESNGFGQGQIAIEKRFQAAIAGFEWSHAIYVRLPEGIVAGFVGGALFALLSSFILAWGVPPLFATAAVVSLAAVAGSVVGAFIGMIIARVESMREKKDGGEEVSIGVLCFDNASENRAKRTLRDAGAAEIEVQ